MSSGSRSGKSSRISASGAPLASGAADPGPVTPAAAADRPAPEGSDLPPLITPQGTEPVTDALLGTGTLELRDAALLTGGPDGVAVAQARLSGAGAGWGQLRQRSRPRSCFSSSPCPPPPRPPALSTGAS